MANQPPLTQAAVDDITTNIMQARQNMLDATIEAAALKRAPNLSRVLYVGKIPAEKWPETSKERVRGIEP